jgi:hypothetical protein
LAISLDYSSPQTPRPNARRDGAITAAVAFVAAVLIIGHSTSLAQQLITWGSCGTGRHEVGQELIFFMPLTCAVPGWCWWHARALGYGVALSRLAFVSAIAGWAVSFASVL